MNKNTKKILTFSVLGLFMFAFAMTIVAAAVPETTAITGNAIQDAIQDPIKDLFTKWEGGQLSTNIAKYLFLALLAIILYSLSSVLPFLSDQNEWLKWGFAIIVGFLATAFITPEEVYLLLVSYGAMGMVISSVIPLIILFFFTYELEKKNKRFGSTLTTMVWVGFVIFMVYRLIAGWASGNIDAWGFWLFIIVIVASIAFILYKDKLFDRIYKKGIEEGIKGKEMAQDATLAARITEKKRLLAELISDGKGTKSHAYLTLKGEIEGLEAHLAG